MPSFARRRDSAEIAGPRLAGSAYGFDSPQAGQCSSHLIRNCASSLEFARSDWWSHLSPTSHCVTPGTNRK